MGLLQKSINITNNQKISFEQFTKKYNLSLCAVLTKQNQDFVITNSIGFDIISILSSVSSETFWEGTIKEKNKWYSFTNNAQMLPFYQFFSFNQKDKIDSININFINANNILIICSKNDLDFSDSNIISDFNSIDFDLKEKLDISEFSKAQNENAEKYNINFTKAVNKQLEKYLRNNNYSNLIEKSIGNQIYYSLKNYFPSPNFCAQINNSTFHILYKTGKELPLDLITEHIRKSFDLILDEESKLIEVSSEGKAASFKDLLLFLQA